MNINHPMFGVKVVRVFYRCDLTAPQYTEFLGINNFPPIRIIRSKCFYLVFSLELVGVSFYPFIYQKIKVVQLNNIEHDCSTG